MCCPTDIEMMTDKKSTLPLSAVDFKGPLVPQKTVHFSVNPIEVIPSQSPLDIVDMSGSISHLNDLWYHSSELEAFRNEARDLCRSLRTMSVDDHLNQNGPRICSLARDHQTRGLEQRTCFERQRRKFLANRCILKAQTQLREQPEKLAALSARCTAWASAIAVEEASRDFVRAYKENQHVAEKRPSADEDEIRRVRARLCEEPVTISVQM